MARLVSALLIALWLAPAPAGAQEPLSHAPWDALLRQRVREGRVDYAGLKADPGPLARYLAALRYVETGQLASVEEQLAFWINAQNACVLKGVSDRYPIASAKEVEGIFDRITYLVGGAPMTVDQLKTAARRLGDWRVHFAMSDASMGGAPLRAEAYTPERLDAQLSDQARQFLRDPARGMRVDESRRFLWVSRIFAWYTKDFIRRGPLTSESLLPVLRRHLDPTLLAGAEQRPPALNFLDYDWSLNDLAGATSATASADAFVAGRP